MLQGFETIFEDRDVMLKRLKKKSFEKNTEEFISKNCHYFEEMSAYVAQAVDKEAAAERIGIQIAESVKNAYQNKRGKMDGRTQIDLNFYMIYYVFPTVLRWCENAEVIAEGIRKGWSSTFKKDGDIHYTDYDALYNTFHEKIFGIF